MGKFFSRLAVGVGALALAAAGTFGGASVASAAQGTDGTPPGNAASDTTGTLIVHKYAGSVTSDPALPNDGTAQTPDRPVLAGIEFTVCQVAGIDLTTSAGWTAAESVTVGTATCKDGTTQSLTTLADGTATFAGLPIGLYLVTESDYPDDVTPAAPFLVSIPYPSTSGTGDAQTTNWLWTVHVYPKNTLKGSGEKTVADPTTNGLGSTVPWQIATRPIGSFNNGQPLTAYKVQDSLDSRLTYVADSAKVYVVAPGATDGTLLNEGTEYVLTAPTAAGGTLIVDFNKTYVNGLPAGTTFKITFHTTVTAIGDGTIENSSTEYVNDDTEGYTPNTVTTDWGAAKLLKHAKNDTTKVLSGAKFEVYNSTNGACATLGSKITVNGATEFTSNSSGVVDIAGLYVGKNSETASRVYCVVETEAPLGYELNNAPQAITVLPGAYAQGDYTLSIPNNPAKGPSLPLTGGQGTMLFLIAGVAIIGAAGGTLIFRKARA
ncbi:SpaH/EbpB family LPXTG-anchored major pilin [Brooklawnia propionicigenes]|nr:SpaH/EbpB family LPXTG-anchored major pilin [Brooklawnia sp. SH051]